MGFGFRVEGVDLGREGEHVRVLVLPRGGARRLEGLGERALDRRLRLLLRLLFWGWGFRVWDLPVWFSVEGSGLMVCGFGVRVWRFAAGRREA